MPRALADFRARLNLGRSLRDEPLPVRRSGPSLLSHFAKPQAPALRNEPVYQNAQEGFRFLAPDGWTMHSRADLPSGPVEKERRLVAFRSLRSGSSQPASFEVSCADLSETADLAAHLTGGGGGKDDLRVIKPPEPASVGNAPGVRITLAGRPGNEVLHKDVVAVSRGGRVYFFTLVVAPNDTTSHERARQAVASLMWKE